MKKPAVNFFPFSSPALQSSSGAEDRGKHGVRSDAPAQKGDQRLVMQRRERIDRAGQDHAVIACGIGLRRRFRRQQTQPFLASVLFVLSGNIIDALAIPDGKSRREAGDLLQRRARIQQNGKSAHGISPFGKKYPRPPGRGYSLKLCTQARAAVMMAIL